MRTHAAIWAAVALMLPLGAAAQDTGQSPLKPGQVSVIGCLQREADFRAIHDKGRGGVLGTGVGVANEYVLADAMPVSASRNSGQASSATGQQSAAAVGTSGSVEHFSLTGMREDHLVRDVGRMVEVVGTVEQPSDSAQLPRLTIEVWHPVADFCPAKQAQ